MPNIYFKNVNGKMVATNANDSEAFISSPENDRLGIDLFILFGLGSFSSLFLTIAFYC